MTQTDDKTIATGLSRLLADSYGVYLKTHGYHWNVRGMSFAALHTLFMAQYTEIWTAIDEVAERIRALGEVAPQGYGTFAELSSIRDGDPGADAEAMLKELIADHETLIATAKTARDGADDVTAAVIDNRVQAHQKHVWMLRASLG